MTTIIDRDKKSTICAEVMDDLAQGLRLTKFSWVLSKFKLRNQYRGSILGPFWITISSAVFFIGLGFVYSKLWKINIFEYLPWLMAGFSTWIFISHVVSESCNTFIAAEAMLKRKKIPLSAISFQHTFSEALFFLHLLPILILVIPLSTITDLSNFLWLIASLLFFAVNIFCLSVTLGFFCARFRDIQQIIGTVMQLSFFMTPIIWTPDLLGAYEYLVYLNPFTSFIELIRAPLLGLAIDGRAFLVVSFITFINFLAYTILIGLFRSRVVFWL